MYRHTCIITCVNVCKTRLLTHRCASACKRVRRRICLTCVSVSSQVFSERPYPTLSPRRAMRRASRTTQRAFISPPPPPRPVRPVSRNQLAPDLRAGSARGGKPCSVCCAISLSRNSDRRGGAVRSSEKSKDKSSLSGHTRFAPPWANSEPGQQLNASETPLLSREETTS